MSCGRNVSVLLENILPGTFIYYIVQYQLYYLYYTNSICIGDNDNQKRGNYAHQVRPLPHVLRYFCRRRFLYPFKNKYVSTRSVLEWFSPVHSEMLKQRKYDSIAYRACTVRMMYDTSSVHTNTDDKPAFSKNSTRVFYGDRFSSRVPLPCDFSRYSPESWLFIACELTLPRAWYLTIIEGLSMIWRLMAIIIILQIIRQQNPMAFSQFIQKEFLKHDRC